MNIQPPDPVQSSDDPLVGIRRWRTWLYRALAGDALSPALFYNLSTNRVVELGTQIAI